MDYIYKAAEKAAKMCQTRGPFKLLKFIGAEIRYCYEYEPWGGITIPMTDNRIQVFNVSHHRTTWAL